MAYRNDGVDLARGQDDGYMVADLRRGEWLKYTLTVDEAGDHDLALSVQGRGRIALTLNGEPVAVRRAG